MKGVLIGTLHWIYSLTPLRCEDKRNFNVSSTNLEQSKLCVNSPLYIDTRLLWEQTIGSNSTQ